LTESDQANSFGVFDEVLMDFEGLLGGTVEKSSLMV
jgi:hypothetical protein